MSQFYKWKTIGYATAIFVTGGISGGALGVYETKSSLSTEPPREQEMASHIRNRFQSRLGLSPDQMSKINPLVETAASEIRSIRVETAQRVNKVFEDSYVKISAILTPEQRIKLNEMQKERRDMMQDHWQEGPRRHGPGDSDHNGPPHGGVQMAPPAH